eukprot:6477106-Amphidinium_carterae.2
MDGELRRVITLRYNGANITASFPEAGFSARNCLEGAASSPYLTILPDEVAVAEEPLPEVGDVLVLARSVESMALATHGSTSFHE